MLNTTKKFYKLSRPGYKYEMDSYLPLIDLLKKLLDFDFEIKFDCGMMDIFLHMTDEVFNILQEVFFKPLLTGRYKFQIVVDIKPEKDENLLSLKKEEGYASPISSKHHLSKKP